MSWPGLNTQLLARGKLLKLEKLPFNPNRMAELAARREANAGKFTRRHAPPPLLRGYTGFGWHGTSVGPPSPIGDCK